MKTRTLPLTQKDFAWVNMKPTFMKKTVSLYIEHKKRVYTDIKSIPQNERTFLNTIYVLERCDDTFESFFSKMGLLSEVSTKKEIRDNAHEIATEASQILIDVEYDKGIFLAVKEYYQGNFKKEKKSLRKEDIKLTEETFREYKRLGFDLPSNEQKKLKSLMKKVSKLSTSFRKNINDYQDYILCTKEELSGLSERFISSLPKHTDGRYIISLQYPHLLPFMSEASNRSKRKELAEKNLKKGGVKNLKIIEELVKLRHEIAIILGYKHHADFKTENRMAKTGDTAEKFQNKLLKMLLPFAKKDIELLHDYAKTLNIKKVEYYDISYVSTQLKKKLYDVDPEAIRTYFPYEHVRNEMFKMFGELFGIYIHEIKAKLWHKDVKLYQVDNKDKSLIGYFTMDMFPREGKFGHAAMFDIIVSHEVNYKGEEYKAPVSSMVCNFSSPNKKVPSLLTLGEVETIFHEFGHCLHMTLSRARLESQAGANVVWDFVETPSQIMENWVFDEKVLSRFSRHYLTGNKMPKTLIDKIIRGKKFQSAYQYTRQLMFGKLDMDLHTGKVKDARGAWRKLNKEYFGFDLPEKETLFPAGFGHLVGYDAGYYSYLWALVYACDAFLEFKTKGNKNIMKNTEVGMKWRREVLEKGSSENEMDLVKNFLGRKPNQKAFLKEVIGK